MGNKEVALKELGCGSIFEYGGVGWALIDHGAGYGLCITEGEWGKRVFDTADRNNFAASTIRGYLNGDFKKFMLEEGADERAFGPLALDLTSDDGLKDYGVNKTDIGLITCTMYRRFRQFIPLVDFRWWTSTPVSTPSGSRQDARYSLTVNTRGTLDFARTSNLNTCIRPICALNSDTLVTVKDGNGKPRERMRGESIIDAFCKSFGVEESEIRDAEEENAPVTLDDLWAGAMDCMKQWQDTFDLISSPEERRKTAEAMANTYLTLCNAEHARRKVCL